MGKTIFKYRLDGSFICSYRTIAQAAADFGLNESTIRKQVNSKDVVKIKDCYLSLLKIDRLLLNDDTNTASLPLKHKASILLLDIETAPTKALVWRMWKENINPEQIIEDWFILSYSCKWLLEPGVFGNVLTTEEATSQDDFRLMKEVWKYLDKADIVIYHNGKAFDGPKINTRLLKCGFSPPSSYQSIDTLETCRRQFSFSHNKLDAVAKFLGFNGKMQHDGFEMWRKCLDGDGKALKQMLAYNKQDVLVLEDVYMEIRAWIKPHPNIGLFVDSDKRICPACGGSDLNLSGLYSTPMNTYEEFRCEDCGSSGRSRFTLPKNKFILSSTSH